MHKASCVLRSSLYIFNRTNVIFEKIFSMKKIISIALLIIVSLAVFSCRKRTITLPINGTSPEITFTVPTVPIPGDFAMQEVSLPNMLDSVVTSSGIPMDNFQSITLNSADMVIDTPATANFDPFDEMSNRQFRSVR